MKTKEERKALRLARRAKFKDVWKKIVAWFKMLDNKILPDVTEFALKIMQGVKNVINQGAVDDILKFIPGDADDKLVKKMRDSVDKVVSTLLVSEECLAKQTLEEKIKCFADYFKTLPKPLQDGILIRLHAGLIAELDENKLSMSEYSHIATGTYLAEKVG